MGHIRSAVRHTGGLCSSSAVLTADAIPSRFHWPLFIIQIARILEGRNRRRYARGWSRLYLHNPSPDALEGSSASATVAARIIRAETVDNKEPVAAEENETRQRAQNTGIAKKGSVAAREEAKRAVARASVMAAALKRREDELEQLVQAQRKHRAIMVVRKRLHRRFLYLQINPEIKLL